MAIRPSTRYPGQTSGADPGYPHGKARNVVTPGDGAGTPWEQDLVNDIFGFQQAMLEAAAITHSDVPDTYSASDYLDAIKRLTRRPSIMLDVSGAAVADTDLFTLETNVESVDAGFDVLDIGGLPADPGVVLRGPQGEPATGLYLATISGLMGSSLTSNPLLALVRMQCGGADVTLRGIRWSADPADFIQLYGSALFEMGGVGQNLFVQNISGGLLTLTGMVLTVARISGGASGW